MWPDKSSNYSNRDRKEFLAVASVWVSKDNKGIICFDAHHSLPVCLSGESDKHFTVHVSVEGQRMAPLTWNALLSMCSPSLLPSRLMITCLPYNLRSAVKCLDNTYTQTHT